MFYGMLQPLVGKDEECGTMCKTSFEDGPSDNASASLAGLPLLTVNGCNIHQACLVMACVHVARHVRLLSLMVLLWRSRWSTCRRLSR